MGTESLIGLDYGSESARGVLVDASTGELAASHIHPYRHGVITKALMAYIWMLYAGMAKLHLGSFEQTVAWCRRAIEANRNYAHPHFVLGAALAHLGRLDEARSAVKAGLALNSTFSISRVRATYAAMSDDPTYLAMFEPVLEGMRKAGAPQQ
jgi:tetratricopeptide (TPR) repeat protein